MPKKVREVLYGCRLLRVRPLGADMQEDESKDWVVMETPQEVGVDHEYEDGASETHRGGDDIVCRVEEPDSLIGSNLTFNDAVLSADGAEVIAGGKVQWSAGYGKGAEIELAITITGSSNDQINIAVDGGSPTEITIAASEYATGAALVAAINAAIDEEEDLEGKVVATWVETDEGPPVKGHVVITSTLEGDDAGTSEIEITQGSDDAAEDLGFYDGEGDPVYDKVDAACVGYRAPMISESKNIWPFEAELYAERREKSGSDAQVIGYIRHTFKNCRGRIPSLTASDRTFGVPSYTIRARENRAIGASVWKWKKVGLEDLPEIPE